MADSKRDLPYLVGPRVVLRLAELKEAQAVIRYFKVNAAYLEPWEPKRPRDFLKLENVKDRIRADLRGFHQDSGFRFFVFHKDNDKKIIGTVQLSSISRGVGYCCNLGYSLSQAEEGHGYMTEALKLAIQYAFEELNLHRIQAGYMPRNERSGRVLRRLGFNVDGYARDYIRINGKWEDHILTSLLNPSWRES